jgi:molybdenum cofactor cytidylyltransferase
VRRAARAALEAETGPVLVLLGADAAAIRVGLGRVEVETLDVERWREGIGATIAAGVAEVESRWPDAEAVIVIASDQPQVAAADLRAVRDAWVRTGLPMAAAAYAGTLGVPGLFARTEFARLRALTGDRGAARLLREDPTRVAAVACPAAEHDVDTEADVAQLPPEI